MDNLTIQFVPTKLHGNLPHIGSASYLRGDYEYLSKKLYSLWVADR
ncbi:hypothetical protein [Vibrio mimicus]|nr:hypothetical protein FXE78_13085 [Vibrio mimicus]